jgi:hypothetical protein
MMAASRRVEERTHVPRKCSGRDTKSQGKKSEVVGTGRYVCRFNGVYQQDEREQRRHKQPRRDVVLDVSGWENGSLTVQFELWMPNDGP